MSSEEEFFADTLTFLREIGADTSAVEPDTNLFDSGVLDSLGTLAFLDFLERRLADEIEVEQLDIESISTLRQAHRYVYVYAYAHVPDRDLSPGAAATA